MNARMRWLVVGLALTAGCGYNTIQTYDEQVSAAEAQIKVQLQRRADLIPNLVETVKGYAKQEQSIFTEVAEARARLAGAVQSNDLQKMAAANTALTAPLGRLLAIAGAFERLASEIVIVPTGWIHVFRVLKFDDGGGKILFQEENASGVVICTAERGIQFLCPAIFLQRFVVFLSSFLHAT